MTKMTKRILSLVLTVLMIVSMVSVFAFPAAMAVEAPKTTDYDAIFEDAFLINPEWLDGELVTDKILYFTFRGEEREVVCNPEKHFNSWADAYEAVYGIGKMDASNIYTVKPVFIFAPGTYSGIFHLPANATIMGNNAGISPNADMTEDEWTADGVAENDGWKNNSERSTEETIFTGDFYPSTRVDSEKYGPFSDHDNTGKEQSRFAYYLEVGKPASGATISVELDGVKVQKSNNNNVLTMNHYDINQKVRYPESAAEVAVTSNRICNMTIRNSIVDAKGVTFYSANDARNNVKAYIYDSEFVNQNAQIASRDISNLTMERVYWHDSGTSASLCNNSNLVGYNMSTYGSVYKTTTIDVKNCIFHELSGGDNLFMVGSNIDRYGASKNAEKSITHNVRFTGNIFYDAKSAKSASAANIINVVSYDKTSSVNVTVSDNIFHQEGKYVYTPIDKTSNHAGNKDTVNFTNNTVTGNFVENNIPEAVYFIDELKNGFTVNGVTFTKENTAVFSPSGYTDGEYSAFFAGKKYIFEIDEENIFPYKSTTTSYGTDARGSMYHMEAFKNKYIVMPSGSYGNLWISVPATYCGANFGVDPVDKSGATAENGYDWALSKNWGAAGETKINTTNITREVTEGDFVFDGFTLAHRFYDDHRNTRTGDVNVTFVNHVLNTGASSASTSAGRTYNLNSALSTNGSDAELGKVYNDSFTLKNTYVVNCGISRDFINEYVCANVTLDNLYLDQTAALKSRDTMGYVKLGQSNLNHNYVVKNSNFRNGVGGSHLFQSNLYQAATNGAQNEITSAYNVNISITNNIFYNAIKGGNAIFNTYQVGYYSSITFDDNKVIATNNPTGYIINWDQNNTNPDTVQLKGNISFNNNTITGYSADKYIKALNWGDANPTVTSVDNHNYDDGVAAGDANCQQTTTVRYTCTGCDEYGADCQYFKDVAGAAGNHVWNDGTYNNDATCQADGTKDVACTVEGCDATDTVTATGTKVAHKYEDTAYVSNNDATCYKAGTETAKCVWCEKTNTRTNATKYPATGEHVWGEYESNNDASYRADGTKTASCTTEGCTKTNTVTDAGSKLPAPALKDSSKIFTDVENAWYKTAVDHAVSYGLVAGIEKDRFGVDVTVERGMFITILARIAGVDTSSEANKAATTKFTDVASGRYYTAAIKWASENGVVAGTSATTFAPESPITRQQLALMIVNFAKNQNVELKAAKDAVAFADAASVASWAKDAVAICQKAGIISGYNEGGKVYFKPDNSATRAEATRMLYVFHSEFYLK